jgi:hypothetical protein
MQSHTDLKVGVIGDVADGGGEASLYGLRQFFDDLLAALRDLLDLLNGAYAGIEVWIWQQLDAAGVPQQIQPVLLVALWVLFIIVIVRLTEGVLRLFLAVFLTFLLLHILRHLVGL